MPSAELLEGERQTSFVDQLLDEVPQKVAMSTNPVRDLGGVVMIACRNFNEHEPQSLASLTHRQYQVLLLTAASMSNVDIAADLGLRVGTVHTHVTRIYEKLGVSRPEEAGTFIPLNERILRSVNFLRIDSKTGTVVPILYPAQQRVFELVAKGFKNQRIAEELAVTTSTVRAHKSKITKKLGLEDGVELKRVAGAWVNLEAYATEMAAVSNTLQPRILKILDRVETFKELRGVPLDAKVIHRLNNPALLRQLRLKGYLLDSLPEDNGLDLNGLVAAFLMNDRDSNPLMRGRISGPIAQTLIKQEVSHFLKSRVAQQTRPLVV